MSRAPKATLRLSPPGGLERPIELRARPGQLGGVQLELYRDDCYAGPIVEVQLDEAQAFLRTWQAAVDEAYRRAKVAHRARSQ